MKHPPAKMLSALACLLVLPVMGTTPPSQQQPCILEVEVTPDTQITVTHGTSGTSYTWFVRNTANNSPVSVSWTCGSTGNITCTGVDTQGPVMLGAPTQPVSIDIGLHWTAGAAKLKNSLTLTASASGCASANDILSVKVI